MEPLWILLGIVVGAGATAAWLRRPKPEAPAAKAITLTTGWRLSELEQPLVVARSIEGVAVPKGARVIASEWVDAAIQENCDLRQVPAVRAEYALDEARGRALLFLGGVRPDAMGLLTSDPATIGRLRADAQSLWSQGEAYIERRRIGELAGRHGVMVEVEGVVQDVLPFRDAFLIRLEDQGAIIGVRVEKDASELVDERIRVQGRLDRGEGGYPVILAQDIRRLR